MRENRMNNNKPSNELKSLYFVALVNVGIWAIGLIALVFILQKGGSPKGMFVILASGVAVGTQIIALITKLKKQQ
ncbi:MAG: hypothetical protein OEX02_05675 [Cyclobacteriaceae bacterium]|nr:hypothetical protein [Cyclobacteriaceae bacterium]